MSWSSHKFNWKPFLCLPLPELWEKYPLVCLKLCNCPWSISKLPEHGYNTYFPPFLPPSLPPSSPSLLPLQLQQFVLEKQFHWQYTLTVAFIHSAQESFVQTVSQGNVLNGVQVCQLKCLATLSTPWINCTPWGHHCSFLHHNKTVLAYFWTTFG